MCTNQYDRYCCHHDNDPVRTGDPVTRFHSTVWDFGFPRLPLIHVSHSPITSVFSKKVGAFLRFRPNWVNTSIPMTDPCMVYMLTCGVYKWQMLPYMAYIRILWDWTRWHWHHWPSRRAGQVPCDSYWISALSREKLEERLSARPPAAPWVVAVAFPLSNKSNEKKRGMCCISWEFHVLHICKLYMWYIYIIHRYRYN